MSRGSQPSHLGSHLVAAWPFLSALGDPVVRNPLTEPLPLLMKGGQFMKSGQLPAHAAVDFFIIIITLVGVVTPASPNEKWLSY